MFVYYNGADCQGTGPNIHSQKAEGMWACFFLTCAIVAVQKYWLDFQTEMLNSVKRIKILYAVQWISRRLDYLHLRLTVRSWKINLD